MEMELELRELRELQHMILILNILFGSIIVVFQRQIP
jgi:hypothetical protein